MTITSQIETLIDATQKIGDWYKQREQSCYKGFPSLINDFIRTVENEQPTNELYRLIPKGLYKPEQQMLQSYIRRCIQLKRMDTEDYQCYQMYWNDKQMEEYFGEKPIYLYNSKEYNSIEDIKELILSETKVLK